MLVICKCLLQFEGIIRNRFMWSIGFFVSEIVNRITEFVKDVDLGILSGGRRRAVLNSLCLVLLALCTSVM